MEAAPDFAEFLRARNLRKRVHEDRDRVPHAATWEGDMAKKGKAAKKSRGAKKGLDGRHRDTTGRIDKKHGNTRVAALRKTYGEHFAPGRRKDMMLKTLLAETGMESLHAYLRKHHK
jgi:hypothetical protein